MPAVFDNVQPGITTLVYTGFSVMVLYPHHGYPQQCTSGGVTMVELVHSLQADIIHLSWSIIRRRAMLPGFPCKLQSVRISARPY